jgi:hypothetical protein
MVHIILDGSNRQPWRFKSNPPGRKERRYALFIFFFLGLYACALVLIYFCLCSFFLFQIIAKARSGVERGPYILSCLLAAGVVGSGVGLILF